MIDIEEFSRASQALCMPWYVQKQLWLQVLLCVCVRGVWCVLKCI